MKIPCPGRAPWLALALLVAASPASAEDWLLFKSGPFEILTNTGEKNGREVLNELEQLRHTLGNSVGRELKSVFPIRLQLLKRGKGVAEYRQIKLARDAWVGAIVEITPDLRTAVMWVLLNDSTGPIPPQLERGLVEVFSTLQVVGTRVTLGAKPAQPTRDWSRMHFLCVDPDHSGKVRVLLGNLQSGVETPVSYKNAFESTPEQIEQRVNAYIEKGVYGTTPLSGRALDPRRQLLPQEAEANLARIMQGDLLLANGEIGAKPFWEQLAKQRPDAPEPKEALGLLAIAEGRVDDAAKLGSTPGVNAPRFWLALGMAEKNDPTAAKMALQKAAQARDGWADPWWEMAKREPEVARRIPMLKKATQFAPKRSQYWQALAESQEEGRLFADSVKSWGQAEKAAATQDERLRIRQARLASEDKKRGKEEAEKLEAKRKTEQDLLDLKNKALAEIRAFEAKANAKAGQGMKPIDPNAKLEEYREDAANNPYAKTAGSLERVECLGKTARLHVRVTSDSATGGPPSRKLMVFLVRDPAAVVIRGGGERTLGCGIQKPARRVLVEHVSSDEAKGTAGAVVSLEFQQ